MASGMFLFSGWLKRKKKLPRPSRVLETGHVNWGELVDDVRARCMAENLGLTEDQIETVLKNYYQAVLKNLDLGRRVTVRNWGRYETRRFAARMVQPPYGEKVEVSERDIPAFKFSDAARRMIARPGEG